MTEFHSRTTAAEVLAGVDLTGRRMIVTGGASGIGAETVRALAGAGAEVTVATREPADAKPLADELPGRVLARRLDLADLDSVAEFVRGWDGPLDALVGNAGIMALPTRQTTAAGWELQLAVNYLGHFALAYGLHDALAAAGSARVVLVSSGAHLRCPVDFDDPQFDRRPYDGFAAYGQSKTADVLLAVGIAERWAADGIVANAVAPGSIHTKLQRHLDRDTMVAWGAMDEAGELLVPAHFKTAAEGASTTVLLAASPTVAGVTARYFEDNREMPVVPGGPDARTGVAAHALDPAAADRLWELGLPFVR
ncbi:SDR family NAD(P)-dependent oxidoreductase [Asanoa sp. WMMD1127]|uniref:SDR family NAD(P)-dependent oxidoreductase n=1 Tax=Asanoa sp. WMMD1127 TaxID=3016107 RepID=UPI002416CD39|nr:SDR family NAD(P)-dependent oxidoreductase [Asanoa sp. WMMD1127]MDG4825433.1 SDR family NAD(P)-dependent oxidoreductase [Asanoa sp. WMMD1127]